MLLLFVALLGLTSPARAWVETATKSHVVTLDVARDGTAVVAHEILVKVRGGPYLGFELEGVDSDAAPLPDASVASAETGSAGQQTHPLLLERRDDGTLRVEVDHDKGLRAGTYVFKLRYSTRLIDRELIRQQGSSVEVRWIGPRPPDGIDSAKVVFRLPPAATAPRLPEPDSEQVALGIADDVGGTFISNLRRAEDKDELELVRPHVAKGEPVVWRVLADTKAFDAFAPPEPSLAPEVKLSAGADPKTRLYGLLVLVLVALFYASLTLLKWRSLERACSIRSATPRALVPLPAALRAALSGAALAAALALAVASQHPTAAGALLLASAALAAHLSPLPKPAPRRPGRWLPLSDEDAFGVSEPKLPGRLLDAGSLPGFAVFATALAGFGAGAAYLFPRSPYQALALALGSLCLLPLFCTGRPGELLPDPAIDPAKLLGWLAERLRADSTLRVVAWARIPEGSERPDELRLLAMPRRALSGLGAVELGVEYQPSLGGPVVLPWVMIRAQEGSPAHAALPKSVVWTRGRKQEERAALLRPKLPTRAACLALLQAVLKSVSAADAAPRQPGIKLPMSSGKGSSTAKRSIVSSPAQAT